MFYIKIYIIKFLQFKNDILFFRYFVYGACSKGKSCIYAHDLNAKKDNVGVIQFIPRYTFFRALFHWICIVFFRARFHWICIVFFRARFHWICIVSICRYASSILLEHARMVPHAVMTM